MKDDYTTNSRYPTYTLLFGKVRRRYFLNLVNRGQNKHSLPTWQQKAVEVIIAVPQFFNSKSNEVSIDTWWLLAFLSLVLYWDLVQGSIRASILFVVLRSTLVSTVSRMTSVNPWLTHKFHEDNCTHLKPVLLHRNVFIMYLHNSILPVLNVI